MSKLNQIVEDKRFDTVEDSITENCLDYKDYGKLVVELLEYNAGSGDFEYELFELLCSATLDYIADNI